MQTESSSATPKDGGVIWINGLVFISLVGAMTGACLIKIKCQETQGGGDHLVFFDISLSIRPMLCILLFVKIRKTIISQDHSLKCSF